MTQTDSNSTTTDLARFVLPALGLLMLGMALNTGAVMLFGETAEAVVTSVSVSYRQRSGNKGGQRREHTAYYTFSLPDGQSVSGSSSSGASGLKKGGKVAIRYLPFYPRINDIASTPFNIMNFLIYSLLGVSLLGTTLWAAIRKKRQHSDS